jgi:hypothetical protein
MLHQRSLLLHFWEEAVQTVAYTLNRTYTRLHPHSTPYESWFGQKPSLAHIHIFGCDAFIHVPKSKRKKLDPKCHPGTFLGYSDASKAYRLWDKITKRVVITRDVLFHENTTSATSTPSTSTYVPLLLDRLNPVNVPAQPANVPALPANVPAPPAIPIQVSGEPADTNSRASSHSTISTAPNVPSAPASAPPNTRPQRSRKPVNHYGDWAQLAATPIIEPKTYHDAIKSPNHTHWQQAMTEEYNSLLQNQTWSLTTLPQGRTAIECKWTYKLKYNADGTIARYKAQLMAKGYLQCLGIDFFETYSPVVCMDNIRIILSIVVVDNLELRQFDIATAFLNGTLQEEIYMRQPIGFQDPNHPEHVCRLHKSLYGLRQANRVWNSTFTDFLKANNLKPTTKDPYVFVSADQPQVILLIFVDDGLVCCSNPNRIAHVLKQMNGVFHVKDDNPDIYIRLRIRRDQQNRTLDIDQQLYIDR